MKKIFFLTLPFLLFTILVSAQPQRCWDFEENCVDPANAFYDGCIPNAMAGSGSPDNIISTAPQINGKFAHMYARMCDPVLVTPHRSESILLKYKFYANTDYTVSYWLRIPPSTFSSSTQLDLILVNDMPNFGGYISGSSDGCGYPQEILPAIPAGSLTVATEGHTGTVWVKKTHTFTTNANFNQLWLRPIYSDAGAGWGDIFIDDFCIKNACQPDPISVEICQSEENLLTATITGAPANTPASSFFLTKVNCSGGSGILGISPITWITPASTFTLPSNSGCYQLIYSFVKEGCNPVFVRSNIINTNNEAPLCNEACDDWELNMTLEPDMEITGDVPTALPGGTTYLFTVDGKEMQFGTTPYYTYRFYPEPPTPGTHTFCVTVDQPDCPPVTKCTTFYIFGYKGSDERTSEETSLSGTLKVSNPSAGTIYFSTPVMDGTATLFTLQGSVAKTFNLNYTSQLNVEDLPQGQYVLKVNTANEVISKLVIIVPSSGK